MQLLKSPTRTVFVFVLALLLSGFHCARADHTDDHDDKMSCDPGSHNVTNLSPDADPRAPDVFTVSWSTSAGENPIVLEVVREWSPLGVDHFYQLVLDNYFNCAAFFRVSPGFVVQFGLASNPELTEKWNTEILDDPLVKSNLYSYVSLAQTGEPNSRTTQIFINIDDNPNLDESGFTPFARVVSGMDVVENVYNPTPSDTKGLDQDKISSLGNDWILAEYPDVDIIWDTDGPNSVAALHVPSVAAWIVPAAVLATILGSGLC
jgi:peptidyl-prolyl cis-trans isomerase A (cyclophilin A)